MAMVMGKNAVVNPSVWQITHLFHLQNLFMWCHNLQQHSEMHEQLDHPTTLFIIQYVLHQYLLVKKSEALR